VRSLRAGERYSGIRGLGSEPSRLRREEYLDRADDDINKQIEINSADRWLIVALEDAPRRKSGDEHGREPAERFSGPFSSRSVGDPLCKAGRGAELCGSERLFAR